MPFTREVFLRLLETYNAAIWPAQVIALGLGSLGLLLIFKPRKGSDRFVAAVLAGAWFWTGAIYHVMFLAALNWAAWAAGALFVLQGGLLAWTGVLRGHLAFRFVPSPSGWIGLGFAGLALAATPLVGLASGPTTLFTLGLLLLANGRIPVRLLLIPVLWSGVAGATAWLLRIPHDLILPVAGITAVWLAIIPRSPET